ncbi:unnamed protein product [Leptidea sinapis]|uniref:TGF-beta propeptide domain-containing protein n=1 Tax=Leptidea sinapis TaxID=189913 RepID=A0A5E4QG72_9NEOP|nr:unnamed protein product [Leptidea sinapis]
MTRGLGWWNRLCGTGKLRERGGVPLASREAAVSERVSRTADRPAHEACAASAITLSVARAARGRRRLPFRAPPAPLCRTTRPLAAPHGPRAGPASLLLLSAWLLLAAADPPCPREPAPCASCRSYEHAREHSLRVIRESLLAKLGFSQAPNTTGRQLPRVPADLMERFERRPSPPGVQADAPALSRTLVSHTEHDDFLARTDDVLVFAR